MSLRVSFNLVAAAVVFVVTCHGAKLTPVSDFGDNPSKITMSIYVPDKLAEKPPIVVMPHPCGGSSQDTFSRVVAPKMATQADKLGFIGIYPATTHNGGCWDVRSTASVTHNGGGDSLGIVSMVKYALDKYKADPTKVFSAGSSSGGMMTNVLLATYPDIFAAGASFSGSPYGCWDGATPNALGGASCPTRGQKYAAKDWGDLVRKASPGFNGTRPPIQVWHGTADTVVAYVNLDDQLAEWSDVLGVSWTKNITNTPESAYTEMVYGDGTKLVGYSAVGVGHMVPFHDEQVLKFFGLL